MTSRLRISEKGHEVEGDKELAGLFPSTRECPLVVRKCPLPTDTNFRMVHQMTSRFSELLPHFSALQELTLRSLTLPKDFFQTVHTLSDKSLRRLYIRACRLTMRYPRGYDPATLRLTDLTLLLVTQGQYTSKAKIKAVVKLARSPILRNFSFDRSIEAGIGSLIDYGVPKSLRGVVIDFRSLNPTSGLTALDLVFKFLTAAETVVHMTVADTGKLEGYLNLFHNTRLPAKALPNLKGIHLPGAYIDMFVPGRPVNEVTLMDVGTGHPQSARYLKLEDIATSFKGLRASRLPLEKIKFNLRAWDSEVLYLLREMAPRLKEISIVFGTGGPADVSLSFFVT